MALIYNTDKLDSCLNSYREVFSDPLKSGDDNAFTGDVILPLDFSLEMDGLSGIIPHSAFVIPVESLPNSYHVQTGDDAGKSKIAFILHTVDQNFSNNKWTTKLTGQTLNIRFEPLTEAEKAAIAAAKIAQNSLRAYQFVGDPPGMPGGTSTSQGGTSRMIKGVEYKNGEMPDSQMRYIYNWKNYKGDVSSDGGRLRLYLDASYAVDKLLAAAEANMENGKKAPIKFHINSCFRTYDDQVRVWGINCQNAIGSGKCIPKKGKGQAAVPGTSPHGFGLAVDFANLGNAKISTSDPRYKWLKQNAAQFGFKRLPWAGKSESWESWHWEYQI